MRRQLRTTRLAINSVQAKAGFCMSIYVTWSSSGASYYQVDRIPATPPTPVTNPPSHTCVRKRQPIMSSYTDTVPDTQPYYYTVTVWDAQGNNPLAQSSPNPVRGKRTCPSNQSGFLIQSTIDTFESQKGSFELLFPQGAFIDHYSHKKGSIQTGPWKRVNRLSAPEGRTILDTAITLIQSADGKFEAVTVVTPLQNEDQNSLASYIFDPQSGWQEPSILKVDKQPITGATGTPALIETQDGPFELLVPCGTSIRRYKHEPGSIQDGLWEYVDSFDTPDTLTYKGISLIQTPLGQLVLIAQVGPSQVPLEGKSTDYLVSFISDELEPLIVFPLFIGPLIADGQPISGVTGSPSLILNDQGMFELLVPRGASIDQYIQETTSIVNNLWKHVNTFGPLNNDPNIQVTATSLIQSASGNLELVARVTSQNNGEDNLVSYEFTGWKGPFTITSSKDVKS